DHLAGHRDGGQRGRVGDQVLAVDEEHRGERDLVTGLARELLDLDHVAFGDLVLLAAGLDDRVHRTQVSSLLARVSRPAALQADPAAEARSQARGNPGARNCAGGKGTSSPAPTPNRVRAPRYTDQRFAFRAPRRVAFVVP